MKFVLAGYGGRGDIEPCAAVGRELMRRGHEVHMAAPPNMLGLVEAAGLAAVGYRPGTQEQINTGTDFLLAVDDPISKLREVIEHVGRVWAEKGATLMSLAKGADLLLAGMSEQGPAANIAAYYGIPLAALHFFPAQILMSSADMYSGITKQAAEHQRRALGLPNPTGSLRQLVERAPLEIQAYDKMYFPEVAAEWAEQDRRRPFVGALTLELPTDADDEVLSWIAEGSPPIYFGFGSTTVANSSTVAMISAACTQLGERALICSGASDFSHVAQCDHVKVVGAVNHSAVFPACRAVVHHGGAGTTAAGLRAGAPTLILWVWSDQPAWAAAIARLEVGYGRPFSTATEESLVTDLRSILAPRCVTRAREVAAQMTKPAETLAAAADLLVDAARLGRFG